MDLELKSKEFEVNFESYEKFLNKEIVKAWLILET